MLNIPENILAIAHESARVRDIRDERTMRERIVDTLTAVMPAIMEEAARAAEGNSPLFDHQLALAECRDCESGFHNGRVAAAAAIRAQSSPDHSSDARNMVQDHIADSGKLADADRPSVKGTIPTFFGDSVCFSGIDHSALILVSVRGNSGLVPIKYLLPHQLYVHDVQKLSEQGEVLVCAVPVYDQQINVTSALPSAPASEGDRHG